MTDPRPNGTIQTTESKSGESISSNGHMLKEKIQEKSAHVGVIGLGYVGLPVAVEYATQGFRCTGFDVDSERVGRLNRGDNYIDDVEDDRLRKIVSTDQFQATTDGTTASEVDVFFVCVPTPVSDAKEPDTSFIESAVRTIAEHLRPGQLIILRSTTYPETTEEVVQPILEEAATEQEMQLGRDYFLAFSPERIDPGNEEFTTENTPVVVGGVTKACTELSSLALEQIVNEIHPVSSPKVAEMEKLLENIFRSVNIALVNELAQLCDRMGGISIWEVVEAAATKPFGFMPFYPGPGLGGHCIPIDPYYLAWLARGYDFETSFITVSARTNEEMPYYVAEAVTEAIAREPVRLSEARVLVLGVAFKANVDDTRRSPAFDVIRQLQSDGVGHIAYSDPHVPEISISTEKGSLQMESVALTDNVLQEHDVAVVLTGHDAFPYARIAEQSNRIIDTRNALDHIPHDRDKIRVLGGGRF